MSDPGDLWTVEPTTYPFGVWNLVAPSNDPHQKLPDHVTLIPLPWPEGDIRERYPFPNPEGAQQMADHLNGVIT